MAHTPTEQPNREGEDKATPQLKGAVSISQPYFSSHATRLPMEILAIIFWMVVGSYQLHYHQPDMAWDAELEAARTVLHASQVCRYWRFAALDCKALWGMLINIEFSGAQWVAELIGRSNPAPLVIRSTVSREDHFTSPKWKGVLASVHRLKVLHVTLSDGEDISPLLHALSQPAPLLEDFRVEIDEESFMDDVGNEVDLDMPLFAGYAPKLQCFAIDPAVIWRFIDFSSFKLVHLDLSHEVTSIGLRLSSSTWLEILAQQPLLRILILTGSVFELAGAGSAAAKDREVSLPLLNTLKLDGDSRCCGSLFANLILPSGCSVYIDLRQKTAFSSVNDIVRGVARFMWNWEAIASEDTIWKVRTDEHSFAIEIDVGRVETDSGPTLSLGYSCKEARLSTFANVLESLQGDPFMQRETTLSIDINDLDDTSAGSVVSFLSSFKKVSQLVLDGRHLDHSLVQLLKRRPPFRREGNGLARNWLIFPELKHVTLNQYNDDSAALRAFYDYLEWRHNIGEALHATICVCSSGNIRNVEFRFSHSLTIKQPNFDDGTGFFPFCTTCWWQLPFD